MSNLRGRRHLQPRILLSELLLNTAAVAAAGTAALGQHPGAFPGLRLPDALRDIPRFIQIICEDRLGVLDRVFP